MLKELNLQSINYFDFIVAFLVFLPTCAFIPIETYLLFIPLLIYFYRRNILFLKTNLNLKLVFKDKNFLFVIGISCFALINRVLNFNDSVGFRDLYSPILLLPLIYFIAKLLNKNVFIYVFIFLSAEVLLGIIEYLYAVSTFFTSLYNYYEFDSYHLLYNTRVFGFGYNSSLFAEKLFIAVILLDYIYPKNNKVKLFFLITFLVGLIITFGRTTVLLALFYLILKLIIALFKGTLFINKYTRLINVIIVVFVLFFTHDLEFFKDQFTRGGVEISYKRINGKGLDFGGVEMSGRREIWGNYIAYIKENIWFGNHSKTYMLGKYHAHNSFLQVLSTHGIVIFTLLLFVVMINIDKNNYLIILSLLALSLTQYAVFWGVSYLDIIFFYFLFNHKVKAI